MNINRGLFLKGYQLLSLIIFGLVFYYAYMELNISLWVTIVTLAGIAALFDLKPIVLPSGDSLSLVTPLLFSAGVIYGSFPVLCIAVLMSILLILISPKKWEVHIFNGNQYGLSAVVGLWFYSLLSLHGTLFSTDFFAFIGFSISYYITNVVLLSLFLYLRSGKSISEIILIFVNKKALLIYFTMTTLGLLMAIVLKAEGLQGLMIFCIVMWGLGLSYRSYYKLFDHFRALSNKDELTDLFNHRYFQEKLTEIINKEELASLLLLDLDHFKIYNDTFGHPQGDKVLQEVANVLKSITPLDGIVCRYGGEEFAIILPGLASKEAIKVAESIRHTIQKHDFYGREHMPNKQITITIGVSTYPDMSSNKENLIQLADQALYKSKYTSRNKVQLYSSVIDELKKDFRFESNEDEKIQSIKTFLTIINSKDKYTYAHTERLMEYAGLLARKIGLPEEEVKIIRYGALLHDIGKVEVPSEILNKQTKLTEEEWKTIKMHVIWGEEIVKSIKELNQCLPIIRNHHERFDGRGYPDQLAGEEIPLLARILCLVDSFDAMTTNRPYQRVKSINEAIEEISSCTGSQFDPDLVEPFIQVIKELKPELTYKSIG